MNRRLPITAVKWIVGVLVYIAVSIAISRLLVSGMQVWALHHGTSRGFAFELVLLRRPILISSLICGALYASALAKPDSFGGAGRVWVHLLSTYLLNLLGCILFVRSQFLSLPNFQSDLVLQIYICVLIGLPLVCFAVALLAWIRLAFGRA